MKRVPIIDLVRFASILIVIGAHFYPRWFLSSVPWPWLQQGLLRLFLNGPYGVTCFFVVSGFLITQMLVEKNPDLGSIDLKDFYVKRGARILPLLLLVVLSGVVLEHNVGLLAPKVQAYDAWKESTGFGWLFWLSLATFTFNWYANHHQAGMGPHWAVLWSLAVEEQFYFCYPLVLRTLGDRKKVLFFLGGVALTGWVFRLCALPSFETDDLLMLQGSFGSFDQIAVGCLLYFLHEKWGRELDRTPAAAWSLFCLGLALSVYSCEELSLLNGPQCVIGPTLMAAGCAMIIWGGMHLPLFRTRAAQMISWPGKLSYGCYLWHSTLLVLLLPVLASLGGLWSFLYLSTVVVLFSFLSYRFFEKPVNRWVRSQFHVGASTSD